MSHGQPSIAPRRRTSLLFLEARPQTAYNVSTSVESSTRRPVTRMSMVMPSSYREATWTSLAFNQDREDLSHIDNNSAMADEFQAVNEPRRPQPRRYSTISQTFKQGVSDFRSLGRRMSLTIRGKSSKQKEEVVEHKRPQLPSFRSGTDMMDLTEAMATRPKSKGRLLRTPSTRRRPSLPLLQSHAISEPQRNVRHSISIRNRGQPVLSDLVFGGAEARAAAAAQNELFNATRTPPLPPYEPSPTQHKEEEDAESGIGIFFDARTRRSSTPAVEHVVRKDPATVLATELTQNIFSFLDVESLLHASLVSSKWHDLCESQAIWKKVFLREYSPSEMAVDPGSTMAGVGKGRPGQDYRKLFQVRTQIEKRWRNGQAAAIYLNGHKDSVYCCQFDEHKIVTGSRDNTIRIWDAHTYQCIRKLGPQNNPREKELTEMPLAEPTGVSPFFKASVSDPGPATGELPIFHQASVLCLQYDDELLVTGSSDFSAIVWSIKDDYKPLFRLIGHHAGVLDVCIDKKRIVTCSKDTTIKIWDRSTGRLLRTLTGHRGPVNAVQVRGNFLASASGDGMAKLWRLEDGVCIKEFQSQDRGLACVEFSENGRTIFAGGNDKVIYEYDTLTGQRVRELKGHEDLVRSLHLDSSNKRIISGSYDHSLKVWNTERGESAEDGGLLINFQDWSSSWILAAKSNYRKIVCTSQDARVIVIDFGYGIDGVELVES